jgi:lysylphosphatidylglycerol synthetase-like protein (DUF2156 family)
MPKNKKQQKPAPVQLPLHESIGKDLAQKLLACSQLPPVCTYERPKSIYLQHNNRSFWSKSKLDLDVKGAIVSIQPSHVLEKRPSQASIAEKKKQPRTNYELDDLNALQAIERLIGQYGRMTHMGVRDHSYHFYLNYARTGVISYRLLNKVAVISGDPISPLCLYEDVLSEFKQYCKSQRWQYAITGGSADMLAVAKSLGWTSVHYARERSLNTSTNPVLLGAEGKRIISQCKQLIKKDTHLEIYCPMYGRDPAIESEITSLYESWRADRNTTRSVQAFVTVFDLFALHRLMVFIYTRDPTNNTITGFAALRKMKDGYHVDPLIARPDAARGIVDLLLISSMSFLREAGIERLVLGVEPLDELGEISGMSRALEHLTRKSHQIVSAELPLGGKKGFNDRFRPDEGLEEQLYILYPNSPSMRQSFAMAHFANIKVHAALKQKYVRELKERKRKLLHSSPPPDAEGAAADGKEVKLAATDNDDVAAALPSSEGAVAAAAAAA